MRYLALSLLLSVTQALIVPSPPGPYSVAVKHFELIDLNRTDSLAPRPNTKRRFMSSVYLPIDAEHECKHLTVPYMPILTAKVFGQMGEELGVPQGTLEQFEMEFCDLTTVTLDMNADSEKRLYPVAIFSPGYGGTRLIYGAMAKSLASLGYVIFTIDHTYEASVVQFPDGSDEYSNGLGLENTTATLEQLDSRVGDVAFLASQLSNDTLTTSLFANFPGTIDPHKTVVYGHSFGGATAAVAAQRDPLVVGGLNFDGTIFGPVNEQGFEGKPFVLVAATRNYTRPTIPPIAEWDSFYDMVDAAKMELVVWDTQHYAFMDVPLLLTVYQIPPATQPMVDQTFGTLNGRRLEAAQNQIMNGLLTLAFNEDDEPLKDVGIDPDIYVVLDDLLECE